MFCCVKDCVWYGWFARRVATNLGRDVRTSNIQLTFRYARGHEPPLPVERRVSLARRLINMVTCLCSDFSHSETWLLYLAFVSLPFQHRNSKSNSISHSWSVPDDIVVYLISLKISQIYGCLLLAGLNYIWNTFSYPFLH